LIEKGYIPLDKSWMIRMGVLDLVYGHDDSIKYLEQHEGELSDDLKALYQASIQWRSCKPIDVGESATLYRFLRFASWKLGPDREFILHGTLKGRKICNNPEIVDWPLEQLLALDNGTSQWASASVLLGNDETVTDPPYKLMVTYDAVEHWKIARSWGERWEPRFDRTILAQASAYLDWLRSRKMDFMPQQAEDYCFARAFGIMDAEEGEAIWPSLRGHESDRIAEMEKELKNQEIASKDHRVIQAITMLKKGRCKARHPESVSKSWPQFWKFLKDSDHL